MMKPAVRDYAMHNCFIKLLQLLIGQICACSTQSKTSNKEYYVDFCSRYNIHFGHVILYYWSCFQPSVPLPSVCLVSIFNAALANSTLINHCHVMIQHRQVSNSIQYSGYHREDTGYLAGSMLFLNLCWTSSLFKWLCSIWDVFQRFKIKAYFNFFSESS